LAAELKQTFPDATIRLVESSGGVFEVTVNGNLLFSKKASGRHAEAGEIVRLIRRSS
jgi:selenoprotein W-related protein